MSLVQFQDVFPVRFGARYCDDLQMLVEILLLQLDKLLSVPDLKQVNDTVVLGGVIHWSFSSPSLKEKK